MRTLTKIWKSKHFAKHIFILACCIRLLLHPVSGQTPVIDRELDSLKNLLGHKSGTEKIDLLLEISKANWTVSLVESLNYANMAYQLSEELNYLEGKADALNRMSNVHYLLRNHSNVIDNYNRALDIAQSLDDYKRMGIYLNNVGLYYRDLKQYDSSEFYLIRALRAKEETGDKDLISSTLNNLGILYRDKSQYNLSLIHFVRHLSIKEESMDIRNLASIHIQIGEIFFLQNRYNESLKHFMNSINYANKVSDSVMIANAYHHIGRSCRASGKLDSALESIKKSKDIAIAKSLQNLIRDNYKEMYLYYKETGNHKAAMDYLIKHSNLKESIQKTNSVNRFKQLERIFEIEKQNNKIEILQKENQIQELQLHRQENIKLLLIVLVIILIAFKLVFAYRFIIIQKTNRQLNKKITELEKTNDKLRLSAASLEQLNSTKNRFFSIIAHDLKNPFNALLGFSEMITINFNQLPENEIREYISIVHQSSKNLYKLLENLLKWSAAQTGTMHYLLEKFDLVSLIHSEIHFHRISAGKKQIIILGNLPEELIIYADKLLLSSVIRNLIDNAIKFTNSGGTIRLSAKKEKQTVFVEVSDSGIGIPENIQKKSFPAGWEHLQKRHK